MGDETTTWSPSFSQTRGSLTLPTPCGRAGRDDVARLERHQPATGAPQRRDEKMRSAVRGGLHRLAVQLSAISIASCGAGLVGRHERRAAGRGAVEHLARHPLRRRELQIARGEVVQQRVAGDVVERLPRSTLRQRRADHERDLGLVVDLVAGRGQGDLAPAGDAARCGTSRRRSARRRLDARLGGVRAVVQADADDLLGVRNGHVERDPRERDAAAASIPARRSSRSSASRCAHAGSAAPRRATSHASNTRSSASTPARGPRSDR